MGRVPARLTLGKKCSVTQRCILIPQAISLYCPCSEVQHVSNLYNHFSPFAYYFLLKNLPFVSFLLCISPEQVPTTFLSCGIPTLTNRPPEAEGHKRAVSGMAQEEESEPESRGKPCLHPRGYFGTGCPDSCKAHHLSDSAKQWLPQSPILQAGGYTL